MSNLNSLNKTLYRQHAQVSTGRAFQKASEAPIRAVRSMGLTVQVERNEQYLVNIESARSAFQETEDSLMAISNSIQGIKDNVLRGLNATYNADERKILAKEVEQLKENVIVQLNKEYSNKHYFGGFNTASRPFTTNDTGDVLYNGTLLSDIDADGFDKLLEEEIFVQTGKSTQIGVSLPGVAIVGHGDDNLFNVIDEIIANLESEPADGETLNNLMANLDDFFTNVQNQISTVGSKARNLEVMQHQAEEVKLNLSDALSKERDIEIEEAIINFTMTEMVYQSALAMSARIVQPTLIDFLR
jgi:flagellar hook-associated protein 3 FlgL